MPDRTIVWGDPADAGTKYRTQDDASAGGGNFVIVEDLDGNTVLLQWNPTAGQFEYQGPVDMGGNDLSNVGAVTVDALEAESVKTTPFASEQSFVDSSANVGLVNTERGNRLAWMED